MILYILILKFFESRREAKSFSAKWYPEDSSICLEFKENKETE
jgi:hypothetical protein